MEHRIAAAVWISGEPASPEFAIIIDKAVLQHASGEVIREICSHFNREARHVPSPAPEPGGFDRIIFTAENAASRPERVRKVLGVAIRSINKAFDHISHCVSLQCRNACYDPISPDIIEEAVNVLHKPAQAEL